MKIGKFLKTTLAVVMALAANAATACQFGDVVPPVAAWMRYIYISGVNEPNNCISYIYPRVSNASGYLSLDNGTHGDTVFQVLHANVSGKSEVAVDLPLTVYIAATERKLFNPGATGDDAPPQLQTADADSLPAVPCPAVLDLGDRGDRAAGNLADQRAGNHRKSRVRFLYDRPSRRGRDHNSNSNLYHCGGKERSSGTSRGPGNRRGISCLPA